MQATHATLFQSPPLPPAQVEGLSQFTLGNFTKIFARWPERFWADRGAQWLTGGVPTDPPGGMGPVEFHDLGLYTPGLNTLFTYVVDEDSVRWETMSDTDAAAALVLRLKRVFPHIAEHITPPTEFMMTRHGSDPLSLGACVVPAILMPDV